jgi:surface protein
MRLSDLHRRVIASVKADNRFIATWDTTKTSTGSSASNQIALPLLSSGGTYNFTVEWGDGSSDVITSGTQLERTHTYSSSGIYEIKISGLCRGWRFANSGDRLKILNIENWGTSIEYLDTIGGLIGVYYGCSNLDFSATDAPVFLGSTAGFFFGCSSLIGNPSINNWDVSNSQIFGSMFQDATLFNQPIGDWDVSNATSFGSMFFSASSFNQAIGNWDVSNSTAFNSMFRLASSFNQPIGDWDVSNAVRLDSMFLSASSFNQNIEDWDISNVTNLSNSFNEANSFAKNLGSWSLNTSVNLSSMLNVSNTTIGTNLQEWYSRTLIGWANDVFARGGVPSGRSLGATNRRYNNTAYTTGLQFNDAVSARAYLVNTAGWTISGDAQI